MAELDKLLDIVGVGRHDDAVRQQPGKAARAERLRQRLLGCGSRPPRRGASKRPSPRPASDSDSP
ncbi:hypothetical protein [Streptomyces sp. NPDC055105]|uniref:hypothetical protein n=1 Tax=Streptomyces sp. NPDC055105 TaxID=3365719 RepID=UPI0037D55372